MISEPGLCPGSRVQDLQRTLAGPDSSEPDLVERAAQDLGRVEQRRPLALVERQVERRLGAVLADDPRDRERDVLDAQVAAVELDRDRQDALLVQPDRADQLGDHRRYGVEGAALAPDDLGAAETGRLDHLFKGVLAEAGILPQ